MISERFITFWWSLSRRRSRKRYLSRVSSGYSWSPKTGSGSSAAADSTSISLAKTSTWPVGRSLFSVPAGRARTVPSTRITHSERTFSAIAKAGESGSATTWVSP